MSRNVPGPLQAHLDGVATTTTRLLKITLKSGFKYGLSMLDRDIDYNDGGGVVKYVATNGFDPNTLSADVGYSVANTEGFALISNDIEGIELEDIQAGELDDAQWVLYMINFNDLTTGRHVILDAGDLGETSVKYGMAWTPELLSYIMRLRQPVGSVWSRTCRAIFGSPANTQTGCGIDAEALFVSGSVTAIGTEPNRVFTVSDVQSSPSVIPVPGRLQFLTGANAGKTFAVEELDGLIVTLAETTNYPVAISDTYRIRPDCRKRYEEDCIGVWENGPNFKGEPHIPVGDAISGQTPGAQLGVGVRHIAPSSSNRPPPDDGG